MGVQCVLEYLFPTVIGDLLNKMSPVLIKTSPSYCFVQRNSLFAICPSFPSTELGPDMFSLQTIIGCFV